MDPVKFPQDNNITYHYYSWQELGSLTEKLARQILQKNLKIDRLIALATGGLTMSRALRDYLGLKKLASIKIEFYSDIATRKPTPVITQSLPLNIDGENILIFDDINDTGRTLQAAKQYLSLRGARQIYTATLFQKPHTTHPSDFFQQETTSWIIFPDEVRETITLLARRWQQNLSPKEIKDRLSQIGFTSKQLDMFLPHP